MSHPITIELLDVLQQLLPAEAFAAAARVGDTEISGSESDAKRVQDWAVPRKEEFFAGRWCARKALAAAGVTKQADLLADADSLPQWPSGWIGSISHSRGLCAAMVGAVEHFTLIGLDLERTDRLGAAAMQRVIHPLETDFAEANQLKASILFSLKEAFYKAQYARWRTTGNFHDLALDVDLGQGLATVCEISPHFAPDLVQAAKHIHFRYALVANYVVSLCWLEEGA